MNESLPMDRALAHLTLDEETAAIRAAQQNPAAFAPLYQQFVNPVFSYLFSRLGNRSEAEDLTSQVFLEALEGLSRYRFKAPFAAWIFTIARRRVIDRLRKATPQRLDPEHDNFPAATPDPLAQMIHSEELQHLANRLARLDEEERELLRLRFSAALSYEAIGALLGRSPAAVKMNVHRVIKRLESQMEASNE